MKNMRIKRTKNTLRNLMMLSLCLMLALRAALPALAEAPAQAAHVTSAQVVKQWRDTFADSKEWAGLKDIKEGESLKPQVLLSLVVLYSLDALPDQNTQRMLEWEPRIAVERQGENINWRVDIMTNSGDIAIIINARTGELISATPGGGGNNG